MFDKKEYMREYNKQYYQEHRTQRVQYIKHWKQEHKADHAEAQRKWLADHSDYPLQYAQRIKQEVLTHYSALDDLSCGCCGEADLKKLSIDHIAGGGKRHRKSLGIGGGLRFYCWLKQQDYPEGYQTLCLGCNRRKQKWDGEI